MINNLKLDGTYYIVNSTNKKLIGYKILNNNIKTHEDLIIKKGTKKKEIDINYIRSLSNKNYYLSNSNISLIIHNKE